MGGNIRHFTYKYNILYEDWFNDLNNIYIKISAHIHSGVAGVTGARGQS